MDFRKQRGFLVIVSAPSGAGKTTICEKLASEMPSLAYSISHTTRKPRGGERDGVDYYFVPEEQFKEMAASGVFVEWAHVHGNLYGTSGAEIERLLGQGKDVILDIDVQGAMQIKVSGMSGAFVFMVPPSMEELERRLRGRDTDDEEAIQKRLMNAVGEIKLYDGYDYLIVNDKLEDALGELKAVVLAGKDLVHNVDDARLRAAFGI